MVLKASGNWEQSFTVRGYLHAPIFVNEVHKCINDIFSQNNMFASIKCHLITSSEINTNN